MNAINKQRSLLQSFYLLSRNFEKPQLPSPPNRATSQRNRNLCLFIIMYLLLETIKIYIWLLLPTQHPFSIITGSYVYVLGSTGKLIYVIISSVSTNALLCRIALFYMEKDNVLTFIREPYSFLRILNNKRKVTRNQVAFQKHVNLLYQLSTFERFNSMIMTNLFIAISSTQCAIESGRIISFVFGFLSHLIQSIIFLNSNAITSFYWQLSLLYLELKMNHIISRLEKVSQSKESVERSLQQLEKLNNRVTNFNKSIRLFLLASIISTTPITVAITHVLFFGTNRLERTIIAPIALVLMIQGWYPCYLSTKIWSKSQVIYSRLNSIQARFNNVISQEQRSRIALTIESLGSNAKPLSIFQMDGEPYTPAPFYQYLQSCILTLILLIDIMNFRSFS